MTKVQLPQIIGLFRYEYDDDALRAYGDARAKEAREEMRAEADYDNAILRKFDALAETWITCTLAEMDRLRAEVEALRKPLTSQQLDALIEAHVGGSELTDSEYSSMVMFAAVVERAHGIDAAMAKEQK